MEKQAYALIKALKEFMVYTFHSHVIAYVPSVAIKDILTRSNPDGRRAKWIAILLEYDLEIKPTKLIKGQGLTKMMAQSNYDVLDINLLDAGLSSTTHSEQVEFFPNFLASPWYKDIIYVLQHLQAPSVLSKTQARSIKLKFVKFFILNGYLYWKDP
jgi:hypothetical protein